MSADALAAAFAAASQPVRYAADKQTIESLLANVRVDPHDGLNHAVLADALEEQHGGPHPIIDWIRKFGVEHGGESQNLWHDAFDNSFDGTFPGELHVGDWHQFRLLLGREGIPGQPNERWHLRVNPHRVRNRQLRDVAYAIEMTPAEAQKFADDAELPVMKRWVTPAVGVTDPRMTGFTFDDVARDAENGRRSGGASQMQRQSQPVRYAKSKRRRVHPLLRGTRLAVVLKELARDKNESVAGMAKASLYTDPTAIPILADALEESNHPLYEQYNWRAVPDKLAHDAATVEAVKSLAQARRAYRLSLGVPGTHRLLHAANGVLNDARDVHFLGHGDEGFAGERRAALEHVERHLRDHFPHITPEQITESLDRVHHRINRRMQHDSETLRDFYRDYDERTATTPLDERVRQLDDAHARMRPEPQPHETHSHELSKRQEKALRYDRQRVGGVKNALRLMQSQNQKQYHTIVGEVLSKLGLKPAKLRDGVVLSGAPISSVVAAIYHDANPAVAEAAAAYFGHLAQLPAVTAFHAAADGPDSLYKLSLAMAPAAAAQHLQRHGVGRAVLVPNGSATDVLIHDPGRRQAAKVAAAANGGEVQETVGTSVRLGHADGHRADAAARRSYRSVISAFEGAINGSRQQPAADRDGASARAAAGADEAAAAAD